MCSNRLTAKSYKIYVNCIYIYIYVCVCYIYVIGMETCTATVGVTSFGCALFSYWMSMTECFNLGCTKNILGIHSHGQLFLHLNPCVMSFVIKTTFSIFASTFYFVFKYAFIARVIWQGGTDCATCCPCDAWYLPITCLLYVGPFFSDPVSDDSFLHKVGLLQSFDFVDIFWPHILL